MLIDLLTISIASVITVALLVNAYTIKVMNIP